MEAKTHIKRVKIENAGMETDARIVADLMVAGYLGCLGDRAYCDKELTLIVRLSSQCTFIVPQEYRKYFEKYEKSFQKSSTAKIAR